VDTLACVTYVTLADEGLSGARRRSAERVIMVIISTLEPWQKVSGWDVAVPIELLLGVHTQ